MVYAVLFIAFAYVYIVSNFFDLSKIKTYSILFPPTPHTELCSPGAYHLSLPRILQLYSLRWRMRLRKADVRIIRSVYYTACDYRELVYISRRYAGIHLIAHVTIVSL